MERDLRLTGSLRGQTDRPEAPTGFAVNNPWRVGVDPCLVVRRHLKLTMPRYSWRGEYTRRKRRLLEALGRNHPMAFTALGRE